MIKNQTGEQNLETAKHAIVRANRIPPILRSFFLPIKVMFFPRYCEAAMAPTGNRAKTIPTIPMPYYFSWAISGYSTLGNKNDIKLKNIKRIKDINI